ncbi:hypothetical protein ACFYOK_10155 [Microbispora bryophytorum]|uniref:hypothetical protein n=1 Tax=Microbispora bryophytorum TaxID=1460882 RepID=UPI0033DC8D42
MPRLKAPMLTAEASVGAPWAIIRYRCPTDRRGIYTDVSPAGLALLAEARPTPDARRGRAGGTPA